MPLYEYRCPECGYEFDLLRRMSDSDDDVTCPACGAEQVERKMSASACSLGSDGFGADSCGAFT